MVKDTDIESPENASSSSPRPSSLLAGSPSFPSHRGRDANDSLGSVDRQEPESERNDSVPANNDTTPRKSTRPELDEVTVQEILAWNKEYPPLHKPGDKESKIPATQERLDYFYKAFMVKRDKYHKILTSCAIPQPLKTIPLALSYQSFLLSYWPGPMLCCGKPFNTTRFFCRHLYDCHLPPSVPPSLSLLAASSGSAKKQTIIPKNPPAAAPMKSPVEVTCNRNESLTEDAAKKTEDNREDVESATHNVEYVQVDSSKMPNAEEDRGDVESATDNVEYVQGNFSKLPNDYRVKKTLKLKDKNAFSKGKSSKGISDDPQVMQNHSSSQPKLVIEKASTSENNFAAPLSRRRPLSPSARPSPLRVKLQRFCAKTSTSNHQVGSSHKRASRLESANRLLSDSSTEALDETLDEGKEDCGRSAGRPKRSCTKRPSARFLDFDDGQGPSEYAVEDKQEHDMDRLIEDQQAFPPQHQAGQSEAFDADQGRLDYFAKALKMKMDKYSHLNSFRRTSPSRHVPLALALAGFIRYYWPGRLKCCGLVRTTSANLEVHISRVHKPPRPPPHFTLVDCHKKELMDADEIDDAADDEGNCSSLKDPPEDSAPPVTPNAKKSSGRSSLETVSSKTKNPPDFDEDQNTYLPQHKPGDPEDFLANKESIDYFMEVFRLKVDKYAHVTHSKKKPLGGTLASFSLFYWPGMVSCCSVAYHTSVSFAEHVVKNHAPPSQLEPVLDMISHPAPLTVAEEPVAEPRRRPSLAAAVNSPVASPPPACNAVALVGRPGPIDLRGTAATLALTIEDELRTIRWQIINVPSLTELLELMKKILAYSCTVSERLRLVSDPAESCVLSGCLESLWNASKTVIVRWHHLDVKNKPSCSLAFVQEAYETVPVFINWSNSQDRAILENVIKLTCTVVQYLLTSRSQKRSSLTQVESKGKANTKRLVLPTINRSCNEDESTPVVQVKTEPGTPVSPVASKTAGLLSIQDFCRLVNTAIAQKTHIRKATGHRDDSGFYHPLYRYDKLNIMLKLYAPPSMTKVRCCNRIFSLVGLRMHVTKTHESPDAKSHVSLSPA